MPNIVDQIIFSFISNKSLYIGEGLTISEHMIQVAMLAEKNKNFENAIRLCWFDEDAKNLNVIIKKIEDYKKLLLSKVI